MEDYAWWACGMFEGMQALFLEPAVGLCWEMLSEQVQGSLGGKA